jgi:hypothetical protein
VPVTLLHAHPSIGHNCLDALTQGFSLLLAGKSPKQGDPQIVKETEQAGENAQPEKGQNEKHSRVPTNVF